jgi:hypothetical protein
LSGLALVSSAICFSGASSGVFICGVRRTSQAGRPASEAIQSRS